MLRGVVFLVCLSTALAGKAKYPAPEVDWLKQGKNELNDALKRGPNNNLAKNVVLVVGDGMGISTITAARILQGQNRGQSGEENQLTWEKFPFSGLSKTYNVNGQVPDSAGTATAMLTGVKTNYGVVGVNHSTTRFDCSSVEKGTIDGIAHWAHDAGKAVGLVTNTRVTHATPASLYAHSANRYWENDAELPASAKGKCKDIAVQFVETASFIDVVLASGRRNFVNASEPDVEYSERRGRRTDGRNLIQEWLEKQKSAGKKAEFVWNQDQFEQINTEATDRVLGMFDYNHMQYEVDRLNRTIEKGGEPHLKEMARTALKMLQKNDNGFFLLLEGGRIDHGHHDGIAKKALVETIGLSEAVEVVRSMTSEEDTLIIVTADHSHVFTIGGFPGRGNNIFGVQDNDLEPALDGMPYHTLGYANSPFAKGRQDVRGESLKEWEDKNYGVQSLIPVAYETHGGEDVGIYASGPMSHLVTGVHEQNYIAHVMAHAACFGPARADCRDNRPVTGAATSHSAACHCYAFLLIVLAAVLAV